MNSFVETHVGNSSSLQAGQSIGKDLEAKYGLPKEVKFCSRCVMSNQRPNSTVEFKHNINEKKKTIRFDDNNICDACKVAMAKKSINWEERDEELKELCDRHRRSDGGYDCLVPGSGGKDSFYAAHILKYKYKMNPLTVTWAPHLYTDWGWKNHQAWIHAGFDNYLLTPNGRVHRLLTRLSVENIFHPFQPFVLGQKSLAPSFALKFKIPLVFYGENEAEYGNPSEDSDKPVRSYDYFSAGGNDKLYLGGVSVKSLVSDYGLTKCDLEAYLPANEVKLREEGIQVHYLGYYKKWHPQSCYYYSVEHGGFIPSPERTPGTYSKYNSIDDKIDDFHYYTTGIKFGIGRATYDASQEIRSEDITREEGVALVKKFDLEFPERFCDEILNYLSIDKKNFPIASQQFDQAIIDRDYFMSLADKFRSPHLWKKENGEWKLRHTVFQKR